MELNNIKQNLIISSIIVFILCLLCAMGYVIKTQRDLIKSYENNVVEQRQLKDNIVAIQGQLLTAKDFDEKLKTINMDLATIKQDLKKTNSEISSIIVTKNITPGIILTGQPSDGSYPLPDNSVQTPENIAVPTCLEDKYGYLTKVPYFKLNEPLNGGKSVPFGEVTFNATNKNPWGYTVLPREYSTTIVLAEDSLGKKTAYAKMSIQPKGLDRVDLPETQISFVEKMPEAKMFWWNPKIMFGISAGYSTSPGFSFSPTMQVYTSSFGKFKHKPDWILFGVGLNYDINQNKTNGVISPFMYKITNDKSIIQNTYIGPSVGFGVDGSVSILAGIQFSM